MISFAKVKDIDYFHFCTTYQSWKEYTLENWKN